MKLLVDVQDENLSAEQIAKAIVRTMLDGSTWEPKLSIRNLTNMVDPVYDAYIAAGLECIDLAPHMYDGSLVDTEDMVEDMTHVDAIQRVLEIRKATETLGSVIAELNFERGIIYKTHGEW